MISLDTPLKDNMKILIADNHPLFRRGLREMLLESLNPVQIAEAENGKEALDKIQVEQFDVVILDINMPVLDGFGVLQSFEKLDVVPATILLTMYKEEAVFHKAMDFGIKGYLMKEDAVSDILRCIDAVLKDKYYISSSISDYMLRRGKRKSEEEEIQKKLEQLTPTEIRILKLLSEMKTSKQMADELNISTKTVNNHRTNICTKLSLQGSHSLLKFALQHKTALI